MSPDVELTLKMPAPPEAPSTFDSGDPKQVDKKRRKALSKDEQRRNSLKVLLNNFDGCVVLTWLLEETGPYRSSFHTNALQMAYLEGLRKLGLKLTDEMAAADPEAWVKMQLEILNPKEGRNA